MPTIQRTRIPTISPGGAISSRQGGAVIIVVLSLLTTLLFLGLFFYNWTSQEVASAQNFALTPIPYSSRLNPNPIFDIAAEQLIVGTRSDYELSALWGGMHSMLAHEIGRIDGNLKPTDSSVSSGRGIILQYKDTKDTIGGSTPDGLPDVVYTAGVNFGGFNDADDFQFFYTDENRTSPQVLTRNINNYLVHYGKLAQSDPSSDAFHQATNPVPYYRPDVGYTYPDINSLFLAHEELATDPANTAAGRRRVLIPSFFRPQLFPALRANDGSNNFSTIYSATSTKAQVFRPHQGHVYQNGDVRYLQSPLQAQSGDKTRLLGVFPFPDTANAQMGIFSNASSTAASENYSLLDVDLDGDGIKDAIWIDLNLPMQELSGEKQYVPLASFKVIDADGLLNLNAHGNFQGMGRLARTVNGNQPVSISNLGMSRSEVNPLWALAGNVGTLTSDERQNALKNVADRFGLDASTANPNQMTLANMEWLMLLQGWNPTNGETEVLGRYGDRTRLTANQSPLAGSPLSDDDRDNGATGYGQAGVPVDINGNAVTDLNGLNLPSFVHPLSPIGLGMPAYGSLGTALTMQNSSAGATRVLKALITNNPAAWPQYVDYQTLGSSSYPAGLMLKDSTTDINNLLQDEDDETTLEPGSSKYGLYDETYTPSDAAFLQLGSGDHYRAGISSRLATLASANFQHVTNAEEIRRQFTTDSWDRLEFNFSAPTFRTWEWGNGNRFPPQVTLGSGQAQPFRAEIRDLMRTDFELATDFGATRVSPRQRLNLNKILSNDQLSGGTKTAFESASPRYRDLVPHPTNLTGDRTILSLGMYHGDGGATAVDPRLSFANLTGGDTYLQEWWARYDRQRLARDIYCLLWVLGCGDDTVNPLSTNPYSAAQSREMAQFAVNVVDAMDRDSIITRFEYDPDLSNGWDTTSTNLQVVYGIEHQALAFNEVLFIRTEHQTSDVNMTEFDESATDAHYHSFVELRNAAPWNVRIDDGCWRIRRLKVADKTQLFSATLNDTFNQSITAGKDYLISCQDGSDTYGMGGNPRPSDFRFDANADNRFEAIVPNKYEATPPDSGTPETSRMPLCDLDLMYNYPSRRVIEGAYTPATSLLNATNANSETDILLVLERRLRPDPNGGTSNALDDAQNPWVEVDRIEGTVRSFNSTTTKLDDLKSQERRGPFDSGLDLTYTTLTPMDYAGGASGIEGRHTLPFYTRETSTGTGQQRNSRAPATFTIWQPHFDRDFSSVMELLSIPLYGYYPSNNSGNPVWQGAVHGGATRGVAEPGGTLAMSGHRTATMRILYPQADGDTNFPLPSWFPTALTGDAVHYQNRWYRLLEYVTVKSQNELSSDAQTAVTRRTPGKINLNTIRHESVFAGLLDDPYHINPTSYANMTQDIPEGANRRWYREHKVSRDGFDPFLSHSSINLPNITIPGGFNARPFRPLGHLDRPIVSNNASANLSVQSTILRMRDINSGHGLYEARASGDVGVDTVDYHTRNRILAKIANNSTTRSHIFFAWVGLDFFEAHQNQYGNVQLGAKADPAEIPSYRMFCIIDMSRLEEAYDPLSGTFDFQKFIIYRQLLP